MKIAVILSLLVAGCASAPVRSPLPPAPMPPLPPPVARRSVASLPAAPLPPGMFAPASVVPVVEPDLLIYPFGPGYYLIVGRQRAGCGFEMQWADSVTGPWNFLMGAGYYPEEQWVVAAIPSDWQPYGRMFVRAVNTLQAGPAVAFASVKGSPEIYTTHKITIKGQVYRLVENSRPGAQFRTYKLVK
jgi:hypothetical protein